MKKFCLSLSVLFFNCIACSYDDERKELVEKKELPESIFDEKNYDFDTIELWGSEAAVVDAGDYYVFQGDIHLNKKEIFKFKSDTSCITCGAARIDKRWPNNTVYYKFTNMNEKQSAVFQSAMSHIEHYTYLTFKPRLNQHDYIDFIFHDTNEWIANADYIGRKGGRQEINISSKSLSQGVILHEICHALGLYHEQCRSDRDKYVKIHFNNLTSKEQRHQFKTYVDLRHNGKDVGEFDFNSIMLYDSYVIFPGEKTSKLVMTKKDNSVFSAQRYKLSLGDIRALLVAQPPSIYTFYRPYFPSSKNINEPYKHVRSGFLRSPEITKIRFKTQLLNKIDFNNFLPNQYESIYNNINSYEPLNLNDYDIRITLSIQNIYTKKIIYKKEIPINEVINKWENDYFDVELSQGFYETKISLEGKVKSRINKAKLTNLQKLMYSPRFYLHIDDVTINDLKINIPNKFGDEYRNLTFINL